MCAWFRGYAFALWVSGVQIDPHRVLHPPEPVTAQLCAAKPARDNNNFTMNLRALQHPHNHHTRARFTVIILEWGPVR